MILKLKKFCVNFLNPAVELEIPTGKYSTSSALGIGYGEDILI
jgi:hypothetical protein